MRRNALLPVQTRVSCGRPQQVLGAQRSSKDRLRGRLGARSGLDDWCAQVIMGLGLARTGPHAPVFGP